MIVRRVYLDNAATTPLDKEVLEAMMPFFTERFGNPSSVHSYGREARAAIEKARKTIAGYLNASTAEIFFTSCGTESANMILYGSVRYLDVQHIITSKIEHHCVLHCIEALQQTENIQIHYVDLDEKGNVLFDSLEQLLQNIPGRKLTVLMHGNNEIGNILDIERAGELCHLYQSYFFTDTVQTLGHHIFDLQKLKIDFLTGSAHKFHGPKGAGLIYINHKVKLPPMIYGGSQERNMRSGTENVYGIVGMAKALQLAYDRLQEHEQYIADLKNYFWQQLQQIIPGIRVNGNLGDGALNTILNVSFPENNKGQYLLFNLDIEGIAVSAGSACSSGTNVGSHVLRELRVPENMSSVRFSFSRFNTKDELNYVIEKLKLLYGLSVKV
jgi:cysteine desulfurase